MTDITRTRRWSERRISACGLEGCDGRHHSLDEEEGGWHSAFEAADVAWEVSVSLFPGDVAWRVYGELHERDSLDDINELHVADVAAFTDAYRSAIGVVSDLNAERIPVALEEQSLLRPQDRRLFRVLFTELPLALIAESQVAGVWDMDRCSFIPLTTRGNPLDLTAAIGATPALVDLGNFRVLRMMQAVEGFEIVYERISSPSDARKLLGGAEGGKAR